MQSASAQWFDEAYYQRYYFDKKTSVVDPQCRVHSVRNLFVAGSAAFPTSSQANPTLTLVALSLRLAQHLACRLQPRRAAATEVASPAAVT